MPLPENPPIGKLPFPPPSQFPADFTEFWALWEEEKFWACHEALEDVWRSEPSAHRRRFLQGIIHLAVAVFQHRRGNAIGASRQMLRARIRLEPFLPVTEDLNVQEMMDGVREEISDSLTVELEGAAELEQSIRAKLVG
jgi:predicted metal-dependent hydrolase